MSESMHPYCFAAWDEADPDWRATRNAYAADAYASEPCSCGHCAACDESEETDETPECEAIDAVCPGDY